MSIVRTTCTMAGWPICGWYERPQWKLVRHLQTTGLDELYDLVNDPGETENLYAVPQAKAVRAELQAKLDAWRSSVGDRVQDVIGPNAQSPRP